MSNILLPLFIFCLVTCGLLTRYFAILFESKNIVDKPSKRRAHSKITPRGGGVAIVISFALCFLIFDYCTHGSFMCSAYLLLPLCLVAAISLLDDIGYVPIIYRLCAHFIASALVVYFFLWPRTLLHNELPIHLDFAISFIGLATFLNIYNFLDGIDGITASESIHLSITILILCLLRYDVIAHVDLVIGISTLVCASSIAFIYYNWHPAKVFLGDVGSISLGLLLGLALLLVASSGSRLFVACFIACLYYIADGGLTILIRLMNGEKIWLPHLKHFFQKAVRKGMSHQEVATKIAVCNFSLMCLSINSLYFPALSIIIAILIIVMILIHFSE